MTESEAKALCENNGSVLISYKLGQVASLSLPSGELVIISIGSTSVKLVTTRVLFGIKLPKVVASRKIKEWEPNYLKHNNITRYGIRCLVLDGLVSLISRFKGLWELVPAWSVINDPIGVASIENIKRMGQSNT